MPTTVSNKQQTRIYIGFWAQQKYAQHFVHMYMLLIASKQTQFPSVTASLIKRLRLGKRALGSNTGLTLLYHLGESCQIL
jgi:hypothetical protein